MRTRMAALSLMLGVSAFGLVTGSPGTARAQSQVQCLQNLNACIDRCVDGARGVWNIFTMQADSCVADCNRVSCGDPTAAQQIRDAYTPVQAFAGNTLGTLAAVPGRAWMCLNGVPAIFATGYDAVAGTITYTDAELDEMRRACFATAATSGLAAVGATGLAGTVAVTGYGAYSIYDVRQTCGQMCEQIPDPPPPGVILAQTRAQCVTQCDQQMAGNIGAMGVMLSPLAAKGITYYTGLPTGPQLLPEAFLQPNLGPITFNAYTSLPSWLPPGARPFTGAIDPVTEATMARAGMDPNTVLVRAQDPAFLDPAHVANGGGTMAGNPNSMALVGDPYAPPVPGPMGPSYPIQPNVPANTLPQPGLNVMVGSGTNPYTAPGTVTVQIRLGDVLQTGGRVYPDTGAIAANAWYVTMPNGVSVPYTVAPAAPPPPFLGAPPPMFVLPPVVPPQQPEAP